jgi:hypothetical protein
LLTGLRQLGSPTCWARYLSSYRRRVKIHLYHRVNTTKALSAVPPDIGVEFDL